MYFIYSKMHVYMYMYLGIILGPSNFGRIIFIVGCAIDSRFKIHSRLLQ